MFDSLSNRLQQAFKNLRGLGKISEANVADALREVRLALLEADVNFKVARDFIERVKAKSIGVEVVQSIQPGQQIIKIIHDELIALLGSTNAGLNLSGNPSCILMIGLHGSGKTTSSGKLARLLHKQGRQPLLVAADAHRPAAMDQLETLGKQLDIPTFVKRGETDVLKIAREGLDFARADNRSVLIFDTAGRLQIDEPLVQELVRLRDLVQPQEILLVLDAATGQEAVNVATHFDQALHITGAILTKLDGDARGGAALSIRAVTGVPILFLGTGEKPDGLEAFAPDRLASRILGMGDVLGLIERAEAAFDVQQAQKIEQKLRTASFDLEDFLEQMQQLKKMGPLQQILEMLPGFQQIKGQLPEDVTEKQMKRTEAIIRSMTPQERRDPPIIDGSRKRRIARGSGASVPEVNALLNQFRQMQRMMKQFSTGRGAGGLLGRLGM